MANNIRAAHRRTQNGAEVTRMWSRITSDWVEKFCIVPTKTISGKYSMGKLYHRTVSEVVGFDGGLGYDTVDQYATEKDVFKHKLSGV